MRRQSVESPRTINRSRTMNRIGAVILALVAVSAFAQTGSDVSPEARKAGEEKAINLCSTCHGPRGVSTSPEFPVLAGQQHDYLVAQLEAFRAKTRAEQVAHDFMWGIAGGLDDRLIDAVARYYAAQAPAPGRPSDPRLVEQGKQL